ncbi:MAG: hypothetical protein QOF49_1247 [Chloroflexota bacterium]|jgi:hypothetical protein|nr:hypothetical protein [Chloroflexota bacterium]
MHTRIVAVVGTAVFVAGVVVFANQGRRGAADATASPAGAAAVATSAVTKTASSPTPAVVGRTANLDDDPGDLLDVNGDAVKAGRLAADILALGVEARDGVLELNLYTAEAPPRGDDPVSHQHLYGWQLDMTGDMKSDWQVVVGNTTHADDANIPGWVGQATSFADSQTRFGRAFPGTIVVEGTRVSVRLPLDTIGVIREIGVAGFSLDAISNDGARDEQHDSAPDNQWPDAASWVTVRP